MQVEIDIFSDVVCPWCYIGKRHLAKAVEAFARERPDVDPVICWMPYFLNPHTPAEGEPYRPFLEAKFGGAAAVEAIHARVAEAGRQAGIPFAFARIARRPNTLAAHRLIHRAQSDGREPARVEALVDSLFAAYFTAGEDIGDPATLVRIAAACGDDAAAVRDFLGGDEGVDELAALVAQIQEMGIGGVPFFVFNRRVAASGAQPPEVLLDALRRSLVAPG